METSQIKPVTAADRDWMTGFIADRWGRDIVVAHGTVFGAAELPGFFMTLDGEPIGLVTYQIVDDKCEIVTLDSLHEDTGIGSTLLEAVINTAREAGCERLRVTTTNDNLRALRFYQRRGFRLVELRPNALAWSRTVKPEIPEIGYDGIPLRDEIELEMAL